MREAVARYYRLLDGLGADDRSLFVSRTIEGLTLVEAAELHGISVSTAQRRLGKAGKRIALRVRRDPLLASFAAEMGTEAES
jgi:DNA-directed RNA polymerase specialized sigma24 family protein